MNRDSKNTANSIFLIFLETGRLRMARTPSVTFEPRGFEFQFGINFGDAEYLHLTSQRKQLGAQPDSAGRPTDREIWQRPPASGRT